MLPRKFGRRQLFRVSTAAGISALLTSCAARVGQRTLAATPGVSPKPQPTAQPTGEPPKGALSTTAAPKAAAAALRVVPRNRTLIMVGLGGEQPGQFQDVEMFNLFDPGATRSGLYQSGNEGLFYANMLNATEQTPWLAESFKYSDDYLALEIKIRKGVAWSDGHPFTAADCAFTINMMKGNPTIAFDYNIYVKAAEAPDDYTFRLTFLKPAPRFMFDYLTYWADFGQFWVPEHVWKEQADVLTFRNYDPAKGWPLVTGPYALAATTPEKKIWDVRPDWWAAKIGFKPLPKVERQIHLPSAEETTMAQMCISNDVDMALSLTPTNMRMVQSQNPKIIAHCPRSPYGFTDWWPVGLGWNCMTKPFDDAEMRWAMSYTINRDEIVKFAFAGLGSVGYAMPFPEYKALKPWMDMVADLIQERNPLEYNLSKSEAIMTRKGYKRDAERFWVGATGQRVKLEIVTFPQHPSATPGATIVAEQLRRGGFDATFLLPADFFLRLATGEANSFVFGHGGSVFDPYKTMDLYHSRFVKPTGEATYPFYRWTNPEFDALLDQMAVLPFGDEKLKPLWRKVAAIWLRELPDTPLVQTIIQVPMNTTYWKGWPSCDDEYVHEGFWHVSAMLMWVRLQPTQ